MRIVFKLNTRFVCTESWLTNNLQYYVSFLNFNRLSGKLFKYSAYRTIYQLETSEYIPIYRYMNFEQTLLLQISVNLFKFVPFNNNLSLFSYLYLFNLVKIVLSFKFPI